MPDRMVDHRTLDHQHSSQHAEADEVDLKSDVGPQMVGVMARHLLSRIDDLHLCMQDF